MKTSREEALLDAAIEAAKRDTAGGLDAMRARVVFRGVEATLAPKEKKAWLLPAIALGSTVGAAFVATVLHFASEAPVMIVEEQPIAQVVYQSGSGSEDVEIAPTAEVEVAAEARLDFVVPRKVRVAVHGPASVARRGDGSIALSSGRASFAVDPHPADAPFKVRARSAEIVVYGTSFDVEVEDGRLAQVRVKEGKVEVRPLDGSASTFLAGGASLVADRAETSTAATFDAPWWKARQASSVEGYLAVDSVPSRALVMLDDEPIGRTPLLVLWRQGAHELAVSKAGHRAFSTQVSITGGKIERIKVTLDVAGDPPSRSAVRDPWKIARALLEAKKCARLDRVIEELVDRSTREVEKARAEMLGAECHLRSGAKARALELYASIFERHAGTQSAEAALFEAAKLEAELGRREASLSRIDLYLARFSNGRFAEAATMRRCELLLELKRLGDARGCLEQYRRVFPGAIREKQALLLLATIARVESRWADAASLYREYLDGAPDAARAEEAMYHRVVCLRRGKLEGLAAAIDAYLDEFPNGAHAAEVTKWKR